MKWMELLDSDMSLVCAALTINAFVWRERERERARERDNSIQGRSKDYRKFRAMHFEKVNIRNPHWSSAVFISKKKTKLDRWIAINWMCSRFAWLLYRRFGWALGDTPTSCLFVAQTGCVPLVVQRTCHSANWLSIEFWWNRSSSSWPLSELLWNRQLAPKCL